jgi:hypothetical protein
LHFGTAESEGELGIAGDFFGESDASSALDAAFEVESDVLAEGEGFMVVPFDFQKSAGGWTVSEGVILEGTFSASVADGAIEGVIDEEKFEDAFAIFVDLVGVGIDDHVVAGGEGTGGLRLWHFADGAVWLFEADFDEAHAAHSDGLHPGVVAEDRDFESKSFNGFDDQFSPRDLDFDIVDGDCDHLFLCDGSHLSRPGF